MAASMHKEIVKQHYDKHVKEQTQAEALRERSSSVARPLRDFHNQIKRYLIHRFGYRANALLDLASGRGGDIDKWLDSEIKYAKGIDLSPKAVEEASRRYAEKKQQAEREQRHLPLQAEFEQSDHLGDQLLEITGGPFDVCTCMFSLHYFFEKEDMLKALLANVAANLKPGGYFIATGPDGKRVAGKLKDTDAFEGSLLKLYRAWEGQAKPFGSKYTMEISGTVVEGHGGESKGSTEFLVFTKPLVAWAAQYGLFPVLDYMDQRSLELFEEKDFGEQEVVMKHFNPVYPAHVDESLTLASRLNMACVFQKVESADLARAPPLPPPQERRRGYGRASWQQRGSSGPAADHAVGECLAPQSGFEGGPTPHEPLPQRFAPYHQPPQQAQHIEHGQLPGPPPLAGRSYDPGPGRPPAPRPHYPLPTAYENNRLAGKPGRAWYPPMPPPTPNPGEWADYAQQLQEIQKQQEEQARQRHMQLGQAGPSRAAPPQAPSHQHQPPSGPQQHGAAQPLQQRERPLAHGQHQPLTGGKRQREDVDKGPDGEVRDPVGYLGQACDIAESQGQGGHREAARRYVEH